MGELIGYARVSSTGQSLDVQLDKLVNAGCTTIFKEKKSGTTTDNRPELANLRRHLRKGDTLVITRLDRLARSTLHLCQIREELVQKGVELIVIDQAIDTNTSTGKLMFNLLGAVAEFENEIRKERQLDGINKAKEKGVQFGRKPKLSPEDVQELKQKRSQGVLIKDLMAEYKLGKTAVYRLLSS